MIPQSALAIVALFASLVLLLMGNSTLGTIAALRLEIVCVAGAAAGMALFTAAYGQRSPMHLYGGVASFYALAACIYPLSLALTHDALSRHQVVPASSPLLLALHSFASERAPRVREQSHCVGVAPGSTAEIMDLDPRQESS